MSLKKISIIKELNTKISQEFPNIILKIKKITKTNIIFEIFYNITKSDNKINKFEIIDGGRKNRIIRKIKNLLKLNNTHNQNQKNIFII